uniref:Uncharacterized protein n=1 Tax=Rhizophora mucronata TaxID=61149 RepID=A0A2P2IWD8_RHIMU
MFYNFGMTYFSNFMPFPCASVIEADGMTE